MIEYWSLIGRRNPDPPSMLHCVPKIRCTQIGRRSPDPVSMLHCVPITRCAKITRSPHLNVTLFGVHKVRTRVEAPL